MAIAVVVALLLVPLPIETLAGTWFALANTIENTAHPLIFWWLTARLLLVVRSRLSSTVAAYPVTFALAVALGLATEYLQSLVGRDASLEDARNDVIGAVFALAIQARRDLHPATYRRWRAAATVMAMAIAAVAIMPLAWTCAAYIWRWQSFPVLWSADAPLARRFAYWKQDAYPGLVLAEPARDWRGYRSLQFRIRALGNNTEIRIRVHDQRHNQQFLDRFNTAFLLPDTQPRVITIPLDAIMHGPAMRPLDLSAVKGVIVFQEGRGEALRFDVGEIRLVR